MGRWDGLKPEKGEETEQRNKGSGFLHSHRTKATASNSSHGFSQEESLESLSKGKQRYTKHKQNIDRNRFLFSSKTNALNGEKIMMSEYETYLYELKSLLSKSQSVRINEDHEVSVLFEKIKKFIRGDANINQSSTSYGHHCNTDVFMALLDLLEITKPNGNLDDCGDVYFLTAQTIESRLKLCTNAVETNSSPKFNLSKSEVEFGITTLSSHYNNLSVTPQVTQSPVDSTLLVAIALLVRSHVATLPPESTAQHVVGKFFVPYFMSSKQYDVQYQPHPLISTTSSQSSRFKNCVFEATIELLESPSHASAILSPLIQDYSIESNYGIEEQTINPLRMELLRALLMCLKKSHDQDNMNQRRIAEEVCVCRTITASIVAIRKLKQGDEKYDVTHKGLDIHVINTLQQIILDVVKEYNDAIRNAPPKATLLENLMMALLQLLRSLVACYPKGIVKTGWKLLIEGGNRNLNSSRSNKTGSFDLWSEGISSYLPLLLVIDNDDDDNDNAKLRQKCQALTLDCIVDFLLVLPFNKWLGLSDDKHRGYTTSRTLVNTSAKTTTSGLYKTVVDALVLLIQISNRVFSKWTDKLLIKPMQRLIKSLLMEIPFCDLKLMHAGGNLWDAIVKSALGLEKSNNTIFDETKMTIACDILVACSGGTVTPQGYLRGMSPAAQTWFMSQNPFSDSFLKRTMKLFESTDNRLERAVRILSSVLRTLPDVAIERWDDFRFFFAEINSNENIQPKDLKRMEVLESFMLGRKDFGVSTDLGYKSQRIITDLDEILLRRWNQDGIQKCITIYSAFLRQDWLQLARFEGRLQCHFEKILSHCYNSSAKIREGAAKAFGEFCTQYITRLHSTETFEENEMHQYRFFTTKVQTSMMQLCCDKNAGVRSMSIFSLGNLASALKGSNATEMLNISSLHVMSKTILRSCNDTNDKVVKNGIRSIGHASNLLALFMKHEEHCEDFSSSCKLLVEVFESLNQKLRNTLHAALNEEQKAAMTWKERSAAKKHGWGACHSLGLVFEGLSIRLFERCDNLVSVCLQAVQYLADCLHNFPVLNEKVVSAAMSAICQISCEFLIMINSQKSLLGDALKTSTMILESIQGNCNDMSSSRALDNKSITSKLAAQNEKCLCHLLNSASIVDANDVITDDRITTQTLSILYSWMVERRHFDMLSSHAFEIFAFAFQHSGRWSSSVELEQQFTSRALQKCKQELKDSTQLDNTCSTEGELEVEYEADEL